METRLFRGREMTYAPHPRLSDVRMATFITGKDTDSVSVCMVDIAPNEGAPVHRHDSQVDSIFVVSGKGEVFMNGGWEPIEAGDYVFVPMGEEHGVKNTGRESLKLFVHHSPPML